MQCVHSSYKKWLNKSGNSDKEMSSSRRNRNDGPANNDDVSNAKAAPRMFECVRLLLCNGFSIRPCTSRSVSTTCEAVDEPREDSIESQGPEDAQSLGIETARPDHEETGGEGSPRVTATSSSSAQVRPNELQEQAAEWQAEIHQARAIVDNSSTAAKKMKNSIALRCFLFCYLSEDKERRSTQVRSLYAIYQTSSLDWSPGKL